MRCKTKFFSGEVRSSDPAGDTIIFRSSDIIDNRTGFRCANFKVSTWLLPVPVRTSAVLLLFNKTENMFGTASATVKVFQGTEPTRSQTGSTLVYFLLKNLEV